MTPEEKRKRQNEKMRRYRLARPHLREKNRQRERERRAADPERFREEARARRLASPEKTRGCVAAYRNANKAKVHACQKAARAKKPAKYREMACTTAAAYRARKRMAAGTHSQEDRRRAFGDYNGLCVYCLGRADTVDHVSPLARGGSNGPENLVPACMRCNASKRDRPLLAWLAASAVRVSRGAGRGF